MNGTVDRAGGYNPNLALQQFSDEALQMFKQDGVTQIDATKALSELAKLAQTLVTSLPGKSATDRSAPPGAPALEAPGEDFSADQLALLIGAMQTKITELQGKTAKEGIKLSEAQKQEAHQKAIAKIEEMAKKIAEAKAKEAALGILGIIGKVLALVAAIALTALTSGAAAPLAAALLVYAVVDTALTVADEISKACGGPRLALDHLMSEGFAKLAEAFGADPEKAKEIGQWMTFAVQAAITIATIACGVGAANAIAKGADTALQLSVKAIKVAKFVQLGASIANGCNSVAQGGLTISKGFNERDAAEAQAKKAEMDKLIMLLAKQMEDDRENVKKLVAELDEAMQQLSSLINSASQTRTQQIKNIV